MPGAGSLDAVSARLYVELRAAPTDPVFADGIRDPIKPARVVPDFEETLPRVIPHAITEWARHRPLAAIHLQRRLRFEKRAGLVNGGRVPSALDRRVGDQVVIEEKLPSAVDVDRRSGGRSRAHRCRQEFASSQDHWTAFHAVAAIIDAAPCISPGGGYW